MKAIRTSYRRWAGPPGRVAAHGEGGSVVKLDARLHEHVGVLADHDAEDVVAPLQEGGHVLAAVERSLAGVDPRRVENGVPDTLSVRRQLSDTAGQDEVCPQQNPGRRVHARSCRGLSRRREPGPVPREDRTRPAGKSPLGRGRLGRSSVRSSRQDPADPCPTTPVRSRPMPGARHPRPTPSSGISWRTPASDRRTRDSPKRTWSPSRCPKRQDCQRAEDRATLRPGAGTRSGTPSAPRIRGSSSVRGASRRCPAGWPVFRAQSRNPDGAGGGEDARAVQRHTALAPTRENQANGSRTARVTASPSHTDRRDREAAGNPSALTRTDLEP